MQILKERLVASLLPSSPQRAQKSASAAQKWAQTLQTDGSWPDIDYADQTRGPWKALSHLSRLHEMAQSLAARDETARDTDLRAKTLRALDFWLHNDFRNPNWFHNQIRVPQTVGGTLLLLENQLSPAQLARGIAIVDRATLANNAPNYKTGANLVWLANAQILRGCLENAPQPVAQAFEAIFDEIKIAGPGEEGIQSDWSFHQHGPLLYSGGYGSAYVSQCARFAELTRDTRFAMPREKQRILESLLLEGQAWMIRGGTWDPGVKGREITRMSQGAGGIGRSAERLSRLPDARRDELEALSSRFQSESAAPLLGNRHFPQSDYMAHHRAGYMTSFRGFSTRLANTDRFINDEGKQSHHIADGAHFLLRRGDEYFDIFPVWNWRRIPGTTVEQKSEKLDPKDLYRFGTTRFVGGVSDGTYGVAAMQLQREELSAHKAWFFFDDEIVCLGAGIRCATPHPVVTTVNQCLQNGDAASSNGAISGSESEVSGARWVRHDGITYLFPFETKLHVSVGPQTGSWASIGTGSAQPVTKDVFGLWIEHGAHPDGATYAYVVRPTDSTAPAPDALQKVEIVANTPDFQAVWHRQLKILGAVFQRAGRVESAGLSVEVDQPCLVLCRETAQGYVVSLSNPESLALQVNVAVITGAKTARARFDLRAGSEAGRSVTQLLAR